MHLERKAFLFFLALVAACSSNGGTRDAVSRDRVPTLRAEGGASADRATAERPGAAAEAASPYLHEDVAVQTVQQWLAAGKTISVIDVREPSEFAGGHLKGAVNLAWSSGVLKQSTAGIDKGRPVLVYCQSGVRSDQAATFLANSGFKPVYDMLGGIGAWTAAGFPVEK
jgi:rhodanese-related sulfurtransferase